MPISEQDWERSEQAVSWTARIVDFLDMNHPKAYSLDEITDELFDIGNEDDDGIVYSIFLVHTMSLLEILLREGMIEQRIPPDDVDSSGPYYRTTQPTEEGI